MPKYLKKTFTQTNPKKTPDLLMNYSVGIRNMKTLDSNLN